MGEKLTKKRGAIPKLASQSVRRIDVRHKFMLGISRPRPDPAIASPGSRPAVQADQGIANSPFRKATP